MGAMVQPVSFWRSTDSRGDRVLKSDSFFEPVVKGELVERSLASSLILEITMELFNVSGIGRPLYCGPAAISALTGKHPHREIRAAVNEIRGHHPDCAIEGMSDYEVAEVLKMLGISCSGVNYTQLETLQEFICEHPFFVGVAGTKDHFISISNGWCLDNHSECARPLSKFRGRRKTIWTYISVLD